MVLDLDPQLSHRRAGTPGVGSDVSGHPRPSGGLDFFFNQKIAREKQNN